MSFNVSSISVYTDQSAPLIKKAVLTGKSFELLSLMPGVKFQETINILTNTVTIAAASCGFTSPAGDVAFTQRIMKVTALEVKDVLCPKTLQSYFMGQSMKAGAPTDQELGQILADSYVEKIQYANEVMLWAGASATTSCSGFIELLTIDGGYVSASAASGAVSGHTSANIVGRVDAMVALMPEVLYKLKPVMFMSQSAFRLYLSAMATANLYHINPTNGLDVVEGRWTNPINSVEFIAIDGLTGKQDLFLTYAENLVIGFDMLHEEEKFDIFYDRSTDQVKANIQWKLGVQVQFPALVVYNK